VNRIIKIGFFTGTLMLSSAAYAVSVVEYFSIQEQASVQNVVQAKARDSLNGLFAGLRDGLHAAMYFGGGVIKHDDRPIVCIGDMRQLTQSVVREALTDAIGTFERPKLSPSGAAAMPLGMHVVIGLSRKYPCH
jgi:hypothetical protein